MRRRGPGRRRSAAASALTFAVPVGAIGTAGYYLLVRGEGLLEDLTLAQNLTVLAVIAVLWLACWQVLLARRRSEDAEDAEDAGPVEEPPRPIREMTGRELADWAAGDPEKLGRLLRRRRRR